MQGMGYRLATAAFVAFAIAGCTTGLGSKPASVAPTVKLDGLYKIVTDGTGTRNGAPVDNLAKGETQVAFRTTCDTKGCVAVSSTVDPANPTAPPQSIRVADYVDGKWSLVFLNQGAECPRDDGQTFRADQWTVWDINQAPEDKLSLKFTVAGTDDCNAITEFSSPLTRIGDLPAGLNLPDPAQAPKRVPSYPANSFRGRYAVGYLLQANGQTQDDGQSDVKTYCLRSEERCVTTTVNTAPHDPGTPYALQVYEFNNGKWLFSQTIGKKPCLDGTEGLASKAVALPLPPAPVPDPLQTLTGNQLTKFTGDCTADATYTVNYTRTGD